MLIASPVVAVNAVAVTAQSATGTCQGANHLITHGEAADGTVADCDQEILRRDARQTQYAFSGIFEFDLAGIQRRE